MAALPPHPDRDPLSRAAEPAPTPLPAPPAPLPEALGAGVYVHVPFCRVHCPYCDFAVRRHRAEEEPALVAGVLAEAARRAPAGGHGPDGRPWGSLYFGGGTPSRLAPAQFTALVAGLDACLAFAPAHERSLEANPEDVDGAHLAAWRAAGVNRVSLGAQSFHDDELRRLGRMHGVDGIVAAAACLVAHGIANWSLDLMYAYPGHTLERFRTSLERAIGLDPPHVAAYAYTPEPGTPMGERVNAGRLARPDTDDEAACFELAHTMLVAAGYRHYEISNFARAGHETRHHLRYWRRGSWLGLGPSAVSFLAGRRETAPRDLVAWAAAVPQAPFGWEVDDSTAHAILETVFLGLRLDVGMRFADLPADVSAGERVRWQAAGEVLVARGLLVATADGFRLPEAEWARTDGVVLAWQSEVERAAAREASIDPA